MRLFSTFVACFLFFPTVAWSQVEEPPATVSVTSVQEGDVSAGRTFVGAVAPSREVVIGSAVDGRVVELYVNDGDAVEMVKDESTGKLVGQPIAQLLTETIQLEIAAARARADLRRHELAELEAGSRPEEIAQAKAQLESATALSDYSRSRYARLESLYVDGQAISEEDFEEARSTSLAAEQDRLAARATFDLIEKGPRKEQKDQARANLATAETEVLRLEDRAAKHTIRARFAGYVVAKHTEVGAWISSGDAVAEVIQLDPIEVRVNVPERDIAHVQVGSTALVALDAVPEAITGNVSRVVPKADPRSRTFPVIVRLPNSRKNGHHVLKAGMLARVTLGVGGAKKALLVPKDALVMARGSTHVVIVDTELPQPVARVVPVEMGVATKSMIQVIDKSNSLRAGQLVVERGNERLRTGQLVEIVTTSHR